MSERSKLLFDPEAFLSDAGPGTTKSTYEEDNVIFSRGEAADSIFYINTGKVKIPTKGRKPLSRSSVPVISLARDAWPGSPGAWRLRMR
jgi:hypothetical protein